MHETKTNMTQEEIFAGLKEVLLQVKPNMDLSNVGRESSLINDLGIDSLSMLLISLGCETKFDTKFSNDKPFLTAGEVIDYIATQK